MFKTKYFCLACLPLAAVFLTTNPSRGNGYDLGDANAEQMIHYLHESRMRSPLFELRYTITVVQFEQEPTLKGCACEYHAWFDFAEERVRVDGNLHCPDRAEACANSRFTYSNQRFLVVDDDSLAGREMHGHGIGFMRDEASSSVFRLSTDPRLVGMLPEQLSVLKNYSTDDIIAILQQSTSQELTDDLLESEPIKKLVVSNYLAANCTLTYWLSKQHDYMPTRILCTTETQSGPLTTEVETKWTSFTNPSEPSRIIWLPKLSTTRQWTDDELIIHETFTLNEAIIGQRPDDALFEWGSMKLQDKFVVVKTDTNSKSTIQWDSAAQAFTDWKPEIMEEQLSSDSIPPAENPRRSWIIISNIVAGLGLVVYFIFGRRSK